MTTDAIHWAAATSPGWHPACMRQPASAAVHDEHVAGVLAEFTAQRRGRPGVGSR